MTRDLSGGGDSPSAHVTGYNKRKEVYGMDFSELHKRLGCGSCYWAEKEDVGEGPCCTKPGRPNTGNDHSGKCGDWRDAKKQ